MAIAFDSVTGAVYAASTSGSFSHTCTGTNRGLLAFTYTAGGATQSGATVQYAGVSMTYVGNIDSGNGEGVSCWKLANPASGSNTFSWSGLTNSNSRFTVISYTGVNQSDIVHNSNFVAQTADPLTPSVTSSIADCWAVVSTTFQGTYVGFNTGTARRDATGNRQVVGDSNGTFTTSYQFSIDQSTSTAAGSAVIALAPAATDVTMTAATGTFTLTGYDVTFGTIIGTMIASVGNFILTGYDILTRFTGWTNQSKNSSTFTNNSKNSSTWTNQSKS